MSNTRTAKPGAPLRQERFASSPEFHRGLMANLVAQRCAVLTSAADRQLVWFLQFLSHRPGGLDQVAAELLASYPERNITAAMAKFGAENTRCYSIDQVKAIRTEIPDGEEKFLTRGEMSGMDEFALPADEEIEELEGEEREQARWRRQDMLDKADNQPTGYSATIFKSLCRRAAQAQLAQDLAALCLDPALRLDKPGPWYFPTLVRTLREHEAAWIEEGRRETLFTEIGGKVCEAVDYAREGRCLVIADGVARIGKTHAAKAWCELNPGVARYVQVPSTNDEIGFYRVIAKSLGVSINLNSKARELRQRIEETLQGGDLVIVLDEAHYLWPNCIDRHTIPERINWVMTALVNFGVPIAMITTPQFFAGQKATEARTRWTSEQFIGRIAHYEKLPDSLSQEDLFKVAKALLPEGDPVSLKMLVKYAQGSAKYLAAIDALTKRARYLAKRDGRETVKRSDIVAAIEQSVMPSDSALNQALSTPVKAGRRAASIAAPMGQAPAIIEGAPESSGRATFPASHTRRGDGRELMVPEAIA